MTISVRTTTPRDHDAANTLHAAVGWPTRSLAGWAWLENNPALLASGAPAGWMLEAEDGEVCGFAGNFVQRFYQGEQTHYGATGFSIVVRPRARGHSRKIISAFTNQPGMFAVYTFNANPASSPLYKRHKMVAWPPQTHDLKLSWRVDTLACAGGRLWREIDRRAPRLTEARRERLLNPRLHEPESLTLPVGVSLLTDLSDQSAYADYWTALRAEGRMIADRSPETMRWRLSDPDLTLRPLFLAFERDGVIRGHALAMMSKGNPIEPPMLEILDLMGLENDLRAIPALTEALLINARSLGAAKLRIQTVNPDLLRRLGPLAQHARHEGGWGHCHVKFDDETSARARTWAPTPFEGDYSICLRPVPVVATDLHRQAA